jgi:hypothetical protein
MRPRGRHPVDAPGTVKSATHACRGRRARHLPAERPPRLSCLAPLLVMLECQACSALSRPSGIDGTGSEEPTRRPVLMTRCMIAPPVEEWDGQERRAGLPLSGPCITQFPPERQNLTPLFPFPAVARSSTRQLTTRAGSRARRRRGGAAPGTCGGAGARDVLLEKTAPARQLRPRRRNRCCRLHPDPRSSRKDRHDDTP